MTKSSIAPAWSEELATGVATLDEQHQDLFLCLADLEQAAGEGNMLSTFHAMAQLNLYAREHFAEEERLMRAHDYPEIELHIEEHRDFSQRLAAMRRDCLGHDVSRELIGLLRSWLKFHVATTDMDYVPYLGKADSNRPTLIAAAEQGL